MTVLERMTVYPDTASPFGNCHNCGIQLGRLSKSKSGHPQFAEAFVTLPKPETGECHRFCENCWIGEPSL